MDQFIRSQNVERYRRLLERVSDELDRQQIINLLAEERQKQKDAGDPVCGGELRPFLIIDLAKISAFPICIKCCCWPNQSSHPLCHRRISVQSQLPAITGGPDFGRGLFFVVLAPFHPVGRF